MFHFFLHFFRGGKSFILSVKPMGQEFQPWTWNQEELSRTSPSSPPSSSSFSLSFFCSSSCTRVCSGFFPSWTTQEVTNRTAGMVFGNPVGSRHWVTCSVHSRLFRLTRLYMMMAQKCMAPKTAWSLQNICSKSEASVHIRGPYSASFCTQSSKLRPKQLRHDHR